MGRVCRNPIFSGVYIAYPFLWEMYPVILSSDWRLLVSILGLVQRWLWIVDSQWWWYWRQAFPLHCTVIVEIVQTAPGEKYSVGGEGEGFTDGCSGRYCLSRRFMSQVGIFGESYLVGITVGVIGNWTTIASYIHQAHIRLVFHKAYIRRFRVLVKVLLRCQPKF